MTRIQRTAIAASAGALAIVLAGCGGSSSTSSPSPSNTGSGSSSSVQSGTAKVDIVNFSFKPSTLTVKVGTKVTYTMEDSGTTHTATGSGNSAFINSPMLKKGQSYTVTFSKAGTYSYICSVHPYMKGTVTVQ